MHNHLTHCFSTGLVNYDIYQLLFTYKSIDDPEVAHLPLKLCIFSQLNELPVCSIIIASEPYLPLFHDTLNERGGIFCGFLVAFDFELFFFVEVSVLID